MSAPGFDLERAVRRNTLLLAGTLAVNSAVVQLVAAVSSLTFSLRHGNSRPARLGPAIFLTSSGLMGAYGGRLMDSAWPPSDPRRRVPDRLGRLRRHCARGAPAFHRRRHRRAHPARRVEREQPARPRGRRRHVPPDRRARGISYVLFGSVFGAILGPTVFSPLFSNSAGEGRVLALACSPRPRSASARPCSSSCSAPTRSGSASCSGASRGRSGRCGRTALRHPASPRRDPRDARRVRELRRHGLRHEPHRLRRRREAPPRAARRPSRSSAPTSSGCTRSCSSSAP